MIEKKPAVRPIIPVTKTVNTPAASNAFNFFNKSNYIWMIAGLVVIIIGMMVMSGGKSADPAVFDQKEVYSTTRITIAPLLIVIGLALEVVGILRTSLSMTNFDAIIIAIVEGLTEFLPISSTGHMIITSSLLHIEKDEFTKLFEVAIQLGAILAVVVLYWKKFFDFSKWQFYLKLMVAVLPALIIGFLLSDKIDELLESPLTVAITMLLGGIVLLFIDKVFTRPVVDTEPRIRYSRAFMIGIWQCIAMIPGVSRSAATIIGGMQQKLTRKLAAEFSFFLAVPTMCAATGYKLLKGYKLIHKEEIGFLVIGNVVAFIVALLAIRFFIEYLQKHGFKLFGYYRIIAGIILLGLIYKGVI